MTTLAFNKRNTSKWSRLSLILIQSLLSAQTQYPLHAYSRRNRQFYPKKLEGFLMFLWSSNLKPWANKITSMKYMVLWNLSKPTLQWESSLFLNTGPSGQRPSLWSDGLGNGNKQIYEFTSFIRLFHWTNLSFPPSLWHFYCMCIPDAGTACSSFNQILSKISGPTKSPIPWRGLHKLCLPVITFVFIFSIIRLGTGAEILNLLWTIQWSLICLSGCWIFFKQLAPTYLCSLIS